MTHEHDDDLPEAGDARIAALYGAGATEEPSPATDAVVLAAAREALQRRSPWDRLAGLVPVTPAGRAALALAGIAGMAVLVVMLQPRGQPTTTPRDVAVQQASPPAPASAASTATASTTAKPDAGNPPASAPVTAAAPAPPPRTIKARVEPPAPPPPPARDARSKLAEIERLLADGRQEEARIGFYAFRERYPNHPVPRDLLQRLGM